jgi:hypothetical protein
MAPIALPAAATNLLPPTGAGDATELLALAETERGVLRSFVERGTAADLDRHADLFRQLREAAAAVGDQPLEAVAADVQAYPTTAARKPLMRVALAGKALLRSGLLRENAGDTTAADDFRAAYQLGRALARERLVYEQLDLGLTLMTDAAIGLREAGEVPPTDADAAVAAIRTMRETDLAPLRNALNAGGTERAGRHTGDYFNLAENADPMWQLEALHALARQRFNADSRPTQVAVEANLARYATEFPPGPLRSAAEAARDLTIADYRTTRTTPLVP